MGRPFKTMRGQELSRIGLWLAICYLYSKNCDTSEQGYKMRQGYERYTKLIDDIILRNSNVLKAWLSYAYFDLSKQSTNSAGITIKKQKQMAVRLVTKLNIAL
jgi:hypothetical protein